MKKILAIGVASAALFGVSSVASAQEGCVNGYRMIKDQVPIRCDLLPSAFGGPVETAGELVTGAIAAPVVAAAAVGEAITSPVDAITAPVEEPLYTGSIAVAPAQDDCLNGWRMIKDQVPVRCDVLPSAFGPAPILGGVTAAVTAPVEAITAPAEEPLFTGSIAAAPFEESEMPPRPGAPESPPYSFAASREECQPGQYWMMELSSGNRSVACE
jgi:hypothetical protein